MYSSMCNSPICLLYCLTEADVHKLDIYSSTCHVGILRTGDTAMLGQFCSAPEGANMAGTTVLQSANL